MDDEIFCEGYKNYNANCKNCGLRNTCLFLNGTDDDRYLKGEVLEMQDSRYITMKKWLFAVIEVILVTACIAGGLIVGLALQKV